MYDSKTIAKYLNQLQFLVNSMRVCEEFATDQNMVEKILPMFSPKFNYIVVAIEKSKDIENMIVEELKALWRHVS